MWLGNFIYLISAGEIFKMAWHFADMALGDLPFEQDWWWHLFTVTIICYVGIKGYAQPQPKKLIFSQQTVVNTGIENSNKNCTHIGQLCRLERKDRIHF
ncbi:MAG: hypothetical protein R2822_31415 [Spirosomataceae bacterium]